MARIALDNYPNTSDLTGIRVVIGANPYDLYVEPADIIFEKSLATEEWQKEFSE